VLGLQLGEAGFLDAARERRVAVVRLAGVLAAGDADLGRVQHDDVVAGVDVRREFGLVLAAQALGDLRREAPQHFVLRVDDIPAVDDLLGFRDEGFHGLRIPVRFGAREKARILSKKRRNLLRLRRIHRFGGGWWGRLHSIPGIVALQHSFPF